MNETQNSIPCPAVPLIWSRHKLKSIRPWPISTAGVRCHSLTAGFHLQHCTTSLCRCQTAWAGFRALVPAIRSSEHSIFLIDLIFKARSSRVTHTALQNNSIGFFLDWRAIFKSKHPFYYNRKMLVNNCYLTSTYHCVIIWFKKANGFIYTNKQL